MPTREQRLAHVASKVKRAKEHVAELQREVSAFLKSDPYRIATKRDPKTRRVTYYLASVVDTPSSLPSIAGDAIQNLRTALDHLAWQIVCCDAGDPPPDPRNIYFPILMKAPKHKAEYNGVIQGASQQTIDAIAALKPYKSGNERLWTLKALNEIDKHRTLLTVGSLAAGFDIHAGVARDFDRMGSNPDDPTDAIALKATLEMLSETHLWLRPMDTGFPLKPGFVLLTDRPDAEPDPNQKFRFQVAINEPGVVEGRPLIETVHQLAALVDDIVAALSGLIR